MHELSLNLVTLLVSLLLNLLLCLAVVGLLWLATGRRFREIRYWTAGYVLLLASGASYVLRQTTVGGPATIVAGLCATGGLVLLHAGLARWFGWRHSSRWMAAVLLPQAATLVWASYGIDSTLIRNGVNSVSIAAVALVSCWLLVRRTPPDMAGPARVLAAALGLTGLTTLLRLLAPDGMAIAIDPLAQARPLTAAIILAYHAGAMLLAIGLSLLTNRRLLLDAEAEIARRLQTEAILRKSEQNLNRAEKIARLGHWEMNFKDSTFDGSPGCEAIYGGHKEDYDYHTMRSMPLAEYIPMISAAMQRTVHEGAPYETEFKIRTLDTGEIKDIHSLGDYDAERGTLFGVIQDVTELKRAERGLRLAASVFSHAQEGIAIMTSEGNFIDANPAFTRITGYTLEDVRGHNVRELNPPELPVEEFETAWAELVRDGMWVGEMARRRKTGERYTVLYTVSAVHHATGGVAHYVAFFTDISEQKRQREQLEHLAHFDKLTGLPNRALFADRLQHALAQSQRRNLLVAVAYLDLDGFKAVNDSHGHEIGDGLLVAAGQRMRQALRDGDTLARVGGDEFIALLVDLRDVQECEQVVQRLLEAAAAPVDVKGLSLAVSASIGVTLYPIDYCDADLLVRHADQAMYEAKRLGKNRFQMWMFRA